MNKIFVIAPHPDDETLGCGGTILKHKSKKDKIYWICVTSMKSSKSWSKIEIEKREKEIDKVIKEYQFDVFELDAFDQYQIKITMNSQRESFPPIFRNLRIIATS